MFSDFLLLSYITFERGVLLQDFEKFFGFVGVHKNERLSL